MFVKRLRTGRALQPISGTRYQLYLHCRCPQFNRLAETASGYPLELPGGFCGRLYAWYRGILAALFSRERTGKGQLVDISYTDSVVTFMTFSSNCITAAALLFHGVNGRLPAVIPTTNIRTMDGKLISLGCVETWFWENFCRSIGREDLKGFGFNPGHSYKRPMNPNGMKSRPISRSCSLPGQGTNGLIS